MKININIGEVLTNAWKITWKFRVLWIFGILAGCGAGNGNRFNFNFPQNNNNNGSGGSASFNNWFQQLENLQPSQIIQKYLTPYAGIIAAVIVLLCVLWIGFMFLGMMGKTGLIKGAVKADGGAESLRFAELWSESTPYFWRMLGVNVLVGLPFFLIVMVLLVVAGVAGYSTFQAGTPGAGILAVFIGMMGLIVVLICVISFIGIVVGMIADQGQIAIVLEDLRAIEGLKRGWEVFKPNWLTIVVMAVILSVLGGVIGFIIAIPLLIIIVPAAVGLAVTANMGGMALVPIMLAGACCVVYAPIMLALSGILQTYNQTVWTLTYRRLTAKPLELAAEA